MPGPAPKPADQRRRRNAAPSTTRLPSEGRKSAAPVFPIGVLSDHAQAVWNELWATPQAVAWERLGWSRVVARYLQLLLLAELPDASTSLLAEVRQLEDRLGLTPMSMLRLRWEIVEDELAAAREIATATTKRSKLRAVDPRGTSQAN